MRCPLTASDSFGAAELFQSVRCVKAITGIRSFLKELGFSPTVVFTDARVLIDGTRYKRISFESKWVAPCMVMIRFAEKSKGIFLTKVPTAENLADIIAKPLIGETFIKHRAAILCL